MICKGTYTKYTKKTPPLKKINIIRWLHSPRPEASG